MPACPHDAIDATGDLERALALVSQGDAALILSVEAGVHFHPLLPEQVVNASYRAGFRTVHRGVMGDELVAAEYQRLLTDPDWGTMIRSTCPVVVEKVRAEYPELPPPVYSASFHAGSRTRDGGGKAAALGVPQRSATARVETMRVFLFGA